MSFVLAVRPALPADTLVAPAFRCVPDHVATSGSEAADLAESAGLVLDPEQRLILDVLLAEGPGGRWAAFEAAVIMARQNGKTRGLQALAIADLFLFGADLIVWTAHLFDTAQEAFRDIVALIDGAPHLSREVKRVHRARGDEGIELRDGRRLNFLARSKTGGRGLTGDRVVLDEAFALSPSEMGSLLPTLSARPNPQVVYASSAGMVTSEVLRGIRDRGRAGGDPFLAYLEWTASDAACGMETCDHRFGAEGCALDDVDRWRQANPALGRRISVKHIEAERRALPVDEFARERLGWWEDPVAGENGIPLNVWAECANRGAKPSDPVAFAVDVAPNGVSAAIVACGGALEVIEHRRGTRWVVERLAELVADHKPVAVGLDPQGPVGALIPDMTNAGLEVVLLEGRESVQACGGFLAAIVERELVHRDERSLNEAVGGAVQRQVGDAWKWSRRDSTVDISPLVAATVARFLWVRGVENTESIYEGRGLVTL